MHSASELLLLLLIVDVVAHYVNNDYLYTLTQPNMYAPLEWFVSKRIVTQKYGKRTVTMARQQLIALRIAYTTNAIIMS